MERLVRKFETAKLIAPQPLLRRAKQATRLGVIYFGSTSPAMSEALDYLQEGGIHMDALRLRSYPLSPDVDAFIEAHDTVFLVEQNRDGQLRMLLLSDLGADPRKIVPVLHYDGTPITARFITDAIVGHLAPQRLAAE
jgi:2-oxoglutarate ferredoxin oxidoreductase subunit alpha